MFESKDIHKKAAYFWSSMSNSKQPLRSRWWQDKTIIEHINLKVSGKVMQGAFAGFHHQLKNTQSDFISKSW